MVRKIDGSGYLAEEEEVQVWGIEVLHLDLGFHLEELHDSEVADSKDLEGAAS